MTVGWPTPHYKIQKGRVRVGWKGNEKVVREDGMRGGGGVVVPWLIWMEGGSRDFVWDET